VNRGLSPRDLGLVCAAGSLALDQASKLLMLYAFGFSQMGPGQHIPVLPFFDLVMVWNPGVSYGLFAAHSALGRGLLVFLAFLAIAGLAWWLWNTTKPVFAAGLGLVIGGAIGNNLIDRLIYGKVADFFHFYGFGHDWYVFNVADCAITFGVAAILYDALLRHEPESAGGPQANHSGADHER
jgi:signal peptidase II